MARLWLLAVFLIGAAWAQSSQGIELGQYETLHVDLDDTVPARDCNKTLENVQVYFKLFFSFTVYNFGSNICKVYCTFFEICKNMYYK